MPASTPLADRFWAKVAKAGPDECWLWTGAKRTSGYGAIGLRSLVLSAHRVSWELSNGPIPAGLCVMHRCDTPACVNERHLTIGTNRENAVDMAKKGRVGPAIVTPADVPVIRARYRAGEETKPLACEFGVTARAIFFLLIGQNWKHVAGALTADEIRPTIAPPRRVLRGSDNARARLTSAQVMAIRADFAAGVSGAQLAKRFGVDDATAVQAARGLTWKHLPGAVGFDARQRWSQPKAVR